MATFKGIQQVTEQTYLNIANGDKIGKLYFVKREDGYGDIYFGTRHYGHFSESEIEQITKNSESIKELEATIKELRSFEYVEISKLPEGQTATTVDTLPEATEESPEYVQVDGKIYHKTIYFRHNEYRIKKNENGEFNLIKDGKIIADSDTISFKDYMVRSGSVVKGNWDEGKFTLAEDGKSTALELVLNVKNAEGEDTAEKVYIDTTDLVDVYTVDENSKPYITIDGYKISFTEEFINKITAEITTKDVKTDTAITVDDEVVVESGKTVDDVVSGIYAQIKQINKSKVNSVEAATYSGIKVDNTDSQNPKIGLSVEEPTDATIKNGHIALKKNAKGELYCEMYYITSDPDVVTVDTIDELEDGRGELTLNSDIEANKEIELARTVSIDLNGKTITNTNTESNTAALKVCIGGNVILSGEGTVDGGSIGVNNAIFIDRKGKLEIQGGKYIVGSDSEERGNSCIYVYGPRAEVKITGGEFRCLTADNGKYYVINQYDQYEGTNTIVITGGKFWDFDPSNSTLESEPVNYVPDGYKVTKSTTKDDNGVSHTVYTVKKA